jgi:hypothetical protein
MVAPRLDCGRRDRAGLEQGQGIWTETFERLLSFSMNGHCPMPITAIPIFHWHNYGKSLEICSGAAPRRLISVTQVGVK